MFNSPLILCGAGTIFCVAGVYMFYKNAHEADKRMLSPFLLMIAGIILIGVGTARYLHLLN